jgi:hypothetical protein
MAWYNYNTDSSFAPPDEQTQTPELLLLVAVSRTSSKNGAKTSGK